MQSFFHTFGLCFQNSDTAFRTSIIIFIPNIIQYSGYFNTRVLDEEVGEVVLVRA